MIPRIQFPWFQASGEQASVVMKFTQIDGIFQFAMLVITYFFHGDIPDLENPTSMNTPIGTWSIECTFMVETP